MISQKFVTMRLSALVLLLGSAGLGQGCKAKAETKAVDAEPVVAVKTSAVTEAEVPAILTLTGTLRGNQETDLAANAAGRVVATSVERGEPVKPGQVLARLDVRAAALSAAEARAQAESARAQEEQAKKECERYEQMKQKRAISDLEYDRVTTQCRTAPLSVEAASARARLAAQNVGDGVIRAPFAGVVTERYVEAGQYVRQDSRVVTIVAVDPLRLELAVPEAEVARVQPGAEVAFTVAAFPERRFTGQVKYVSGAVRETTRDLVVEALVPNPDRVLKPGMFANVQLTVGQRKLPALPQAAVFQRDQHSHAFFVVNGRLEQRVLATGPKTADLVTVQKGATVGEQVALGDLTQLSNGQRVR